MPGQLWTLSYGGHKSWYHTCDVRYTYVPDVIPGSIWGRDIGGEGGCEGGGTRWRLPLHSIRRLPLSGSSMYVL